LPAVIPTFFSPPPLFHFSLLPPSPLCFGGFRFSPFLHRGLQIVFPLVVELWLSRKTPFPFVLLLGPPMKISSPTLVVFCQYGLRVLSGDLPLVYILSVRPRPFDSMRERGSTFRLIYLFFTFFLCFFSRFSTWLIFSFFFQLGDLKRRDRDAPAVAFFVFLRPSFFQAPSPA